MLLRLARALPALICVMLGACRSPAPERPAIYEAEPFQAPLLEDEDGVIGGPIDPSRFEFEPELAEDTPPPILEGVPGPAVEIAAAIAPYLEARRVRLASITSDGSRMLVLTRETATTQVYAITQPLGPLEQLTFGNEPVVQASPVPGQPNTLVFRRDRGGDEDFQIYRRELDSQLETLLTDGSSRHGPFRISNAGGAPLLAFTGNGRAEPDLDIYLSTLADQPPILALVREGQWLVLGWTNNGQHLLLRRFWSVERSMIYVADLDSGSVDPLVDDIDQASFLDARFNGRGELDVLGDFGHDFVAVHTRGTDGQWRRQTPELAADVESFARLSDGALAYAINDDGSSRLFVAELDQSSRELSLPHAAVLANLRTAGPRRLAFTLSSALLAPDPYTLDVDRDELARWTVSNPGGETLDFVEPDGERAPSSDGLEVPMLIYRPRGQGPFPVLLWMHGGPEEQSRPEFNPIIQYFVDRGIAIIAPNVRGSDGYGRRYRGLDDGLLRAGAIDDVGAVLDWLEARPEFDATRVGIYGASYGGFLVLASLVTYPDRFVAGCDVVGIANLVTFLENTRGYRQALRRPEYGDERDPATREFMLAISPLTHVDRIEAPLFVAHGANDPRVPVSEAEQIVNALRERGKDVWYMLAPTEGHGFRQQINRDTFYVAMAMFFERYLLDGAAQPGVGDPRAVEVAPSPAGGAAGPDPASPPA
ncbi:MAG TPA: prolyl oligopeptidase family serine peptidase [Enhygromyxa sp.]|nr:prolyl oligopeptidase family serine peptidase [Enhygromyxa sp.]